MDKRQAVVAAVERVGESIAASAGTVIAALLSLLVADFGLYRDLGVPAGHRHRAHAAGRADPAAGAAGHPRPGGVLALPHRPLPDGQAEKPGLWGGRRPASCTARRSRSISGVVVFGALARGQPRLHRGRLRLRQRRPGRQRLRRRPGRAHRALPAGRGQPDHRSTCGGTTPVWTAPAGRRPGRRACSQAAPEFTAVSGPLNPQRHAAHARPAERAARHARHPGAGRRAGPRGRGGRHPAARGPARVRAPRPSTSAPTAARSLFNASAAGRRPGGHGGAERGARRSARRPTRGRGRAPARPTTACPARRRRSTTSSATSNGDLKRVVPVAIVIIGVLLALVMRSLVAPLYLIVSVGLSATWPRSACACWSSRSASATAG